MSLLSALGVAPAAEAWAVPAKRWLGVFSGPDVLFFDEASARRAAGRGGTVRPMVIGQDDDEDDEEETVGPFGGRTQTLGGTPWASGFGGGRGPWA